MKTKTIQERIQTARAVSPEEAEGVVDRAELYVFTNTFVVNIVLNIIHGGRRGLNLTSSVVKRRPQRAGWADGGITKLISDTPTKRPFVFVKS